MDESKSNVMSLIEQMLPELTPKGRILADYVTNTPRDAVFLSTRALAAECGVSESTVVRFVGQLGFEGYTEFIQALRDHIDSELTLLDRVELSEMRQIEPTDWVRKAIVEELDDLKRLYETVEPEAIGKVVDVMLGASSVCLVGSRLSYTFAYYLGWSMTKIRPGVQILKGSDSTAIDWLTVSPKGSVVVIIATSRYPNELIKLAKLVRRQGRTLVVISDSALCPINAFGHHYLVAPCKHIPILGSPSVLSCLINCLTYEMIRKGGASVRAHQGKLEQAYRENDVLFNLDQIFENIELEGNGSH